MPTERYETRLSATVLNVRVPALASKKHVGDGDVYATLVEPAADIRAVHFLANPSRPIFNSLVSTAFQELSFFDTRCIPLLHVALQLAVWHAVFKIYACSHSRAGQ